MTRDWPHDLSKLQEIALEEIMPQWEQEWTDPTRQWPTHEWLVDNGFSNLRWILEEKHDLTVPVFFSMIVGVKDEETRWKIKDPSTINRAEEFLDRCARYRGWRAGTKKTNFYLLNRVFDECTDQFNNDRISLIELAQDQENKTEIFDQFVEVIYQIKQEAATDDSAYKYLRAIQRFYESLQRRSIIEDNPIRGIEEEFQWEFERNGATPLNGRQIQALWEAAEELVDYLLIIGYIIWGVRRKELPSIRRSQFNLSADPIEIEFAEEDRKNGAGVVEVLFGEQYIIEQFERVESQSATDAYFLLDEDDKSKPMKPKKAADRFGALCEKAGVSIDGETPTPSNGRAVWHDFNARAEALLKEMTEYKQDQDLVDAEAARRYHDEDTKEKMRQMLYLKRFKQLLPETAYSEDFVFLRDVEEQYGLEISEWADQ